MDQVHTRSTSETDVKRDIKISYLNCNSYCITNVIELEFPKANIDPLSGICSGLASSHFAIMQIS